MIISIILKIFRDSRFGMTTEPFVVPQEIMDKMRNHLSNIARIVDNDSVCHHEDLSFEFSNAESAKMFVSCLMDRSLRDWVGKHNDNCEDKNVEFVWDERSDFYYLLTKRYDHKRIDELQIYVNGNCAGCVNEFSKYITYEYFQVIGKNERAVIEITRPNLDIHNEEKCWNGSLVEVGNCYIDTKDVYEKWYKSALNIKSANKHSMDDSSLIFYLKKPSKDKYCYGTDSENPIFEFVNKNPDSSVDDYLAYIAEGKVFFSNKSLLGCDFFVYVKKIQKLTSKYWLSKNGQYQFRVIVDKINEYTFTDRNQKGLIIRQEEIQKVSEY